MNKFISLLRLVVAPIAAAFAALRRNAALVVAINTAPTMPTTAFDTSKIARIVKSYAVYTVSGGSPVTIPGKIFEADGKTSVIDRKIPDSAGILRADFHAATEAEENYIMTDIEEIDTILTLIGGFTGISRGSVQFFCRDPRDASGKVRLLSESFSCCVMREGVVKGDNTIMKNPTLKFMSEKSGAVTWTPAGDVS